MCVTPADPGGIESIPVREDEPSPSNPNPSRSACASSVTASVPSTNDIPLDTTSTVRGRGFACNRPVTASTAPGRKPRSVFSIPASPPIRSNSVRPAMSCSVVPGASGSSSSSSSSSSSPASPSSHFGAIRSGARGRSVANARNRATLRTRVTSAVAVTTLWGLAGSPSAGRVAGHAGIDSRSRAEGVCPTTSATRLAIGNASGPVRSSSDGSMGTGRSFASDAAVLDSSALIRVLLLVAIVEAPALEPRLTSLSLLTSMTSHGSHSLTRSRTVHRTSTSTQPPPPKTTSSGSMSFTTSSATNVRSLVRWPKGGTVPGTYPACATVSSRVASLTRLFARPRRRAIFLWSTRAVPFVTHTAKHPSHAKTIDFTICSTGTPSAIALDSTSGVSFGHFTSSTRDPAPSSLRASIHARRFAEVRTGGASVASVASEATTRAVPTGVVRCVADWLPPMPATRLCDGITRGARARAGDAAKTREGESMHRNDARPRRRARAPKH